ncbi:MAG: hypothetical protein IBX50_04150 [Marinospirillum sp.]|uniref:hypothetical protein n=1 Tax=Marinospirillum sp. TaxID=2183934 RepID=UPI001A07F062|nr:hypothetical protein [Marinospirillum sp.]MBE0505898.1 hypothetical protein [Marinospirillum sp.]
MAEPQLPTRVMEFKEFEQAFNAQRKTNAQERQFVEGTLSPTMIERALRKGTGIEVPGEKQGKGFYSNQELQAFRKMIKRIQGETGGTASRGAPVKQILGMSAREDIKRANQQIKYSRLYQVRGGLLKFTVPASGESGFDGFYQVRVRLEQWDGALVSGKRWEKAAADAAAGRVSVDCQCGRHQYWYRYLAGVGGFALTPPTEKDFPKIRNPTLDGAACKHIIKTLQTLQSPTVHRVLAQELERQADAVGYANITSRYLSQKDHETLKRARARKTDQESVAKAYKDYLQSVKGMKKAVKAEKKRRDKVEVETENKRLRAQQKLAARKLEQQQEANRKLAAEANINKMAAQLNKARMDAVMRAATSGGDPQQAAIRAADEFARSYAAENSMDPAQVQKIIEENQL